MKNLTFLSNFWRKVSAKVHGQDIGLGLRSQCSDVSLDRWLTVGSPSVHSANGVGSFMVRVNPRITPMRFTFALLLFLTLGVGNAWGAYSATFTRISSISELSANDSVLVVIQDAKTKTSGYAVQNNSTNYSAVTIATSTNTITCTNNKCVWKVGKSSSNWYFQRGSQYIAWTSSTTLSATGTTSNTYTWTIANLSGYSGYLRIKNTGTGTRDIGWSGSKFAAYANSNYVNQMSVTAHNLKQYDGAMSIYKKSASCGAPTAPTKGSYFWTPLFRHTTACQTSCYNDEFFMFLLIYSHYVNVRFNLCYSTD